MRIIGKIILFLILLFVICLILQKIIDEGLEKSNYSREYKEWYEIFHDKINSDILIQGSSRAFRQISPKILESNLKMSAYNLGMNGYQFLMQYYRFKVYEKYCSKQPKYILQIVDIISCEKGKGLFKIEQFIPFLNEKIIREGTSHFEGFDFRDYYIPLYKYTKSSDIALSGFLNFFNNKDALNNNKYKGFESVNQKWDFTFNAYQKKNPLGFKTIPNPYIYKQFEDFLKYCNKNNIKVILILSPEYIELQKLELSRDSIVNLYKKFSIKYSIPFLDYSNDSLSYSTEYFYDSHHLNMEGEEIFNKELVNDLKKIIIKP